MGMRPHDHRPDTAHNAPLELDPFVAVVFLGSDHLLGVNNEGGGKGDIQRTRDQRREPSAFDDQVCNVS